jgi:phage tail sheath protein FI
MTDYARLYGIRVSSGILYDVLDTYFHEGGSKAIVSRVVGPASAIATKNLLDGSAGISLVVTAKNTGVWGNALRIAVIAPDVTGFKLQVSTVADGILETSSDLANQAAAIAWAQYSNYVNVALGATALNPALIAATALTAGADDNASITEAHWKLALDKFSADLGPGQVSHPGRTTTQGYADVLAHGALNNRAALLDAADTATKATLLTACSSARTNGRRGALFGPWVLIPGITAGTTRTVPPSPVVAGLIARNDPANGAGSPAAGDRGRSQYGLSLSQAAWTDVDRQDLNAAGFNAVIMKYGGVRVYGWRSLADPVIDPNWIQYSNWRLGMYIIGKLNPVLESFLFSVIDGQKTTLSEFGGAIKAELLPIWSSGQLYGANPSDSFDINVGDQVNTPTTIQNGEIHAVVSVRMSPFAELVQLELVKRSITEAVA